MPAARDCGRMDDDPELVAIRARLRQEMAAAAATPAPPASAPDHPVDVTDASFQAFVAEHPFVVLDCWAPWCGPCRVVSPILEQLAREMRGRVAFAKLNVDENPRVPQAFGVQGLPTLLLFRGGRLVDRVVGALPKARLAGLLEGHLGRRATGTPGPRG